MTPCHESHTHGPGVDDYLADLHDPARLEPDPGLAEEGCTCTYHSPDDECPLHGFEQWKLNRTAKLPYNRLAAGPPQGPVPVKGYTHVRRLGDFLHRVFMRPLDPPAEHCIDCPRCGLMIVVECEDED